MHLGAFAQSECFSILYLQGDLAAKPTRHQQDWYWPKIHQEPMQYLAFRNLLHKQNIKDRKGSFVRQPAMLEGQPTWHFLVYFQKEYWKWCMMEQEVHAWDFMAKRGKVPLLATNRKIYSCNITTLRAKDSLFQLEESRSRERCTQVHF